MSRPAWCCRRDAHPEDVRLWFRTPWRGFGPPQGMTPVASIWGVLFHPSIRRHSLIANLGDAQPLAGDGSSLLRLSRGIFFSQISLCLSLLKFKKIYYMVLQKNIYLVVLLQHVGLAAPWHVGS